MKRNEMVSEGTTQLNLAEDAIEQSLIELNALTIKLCQMRIDNGLSLHYGQDVVVAAAKTYLNLAEARGNMIQLHNGLATIKTQLVGKTVAAGTRPKPNEAGVIPGLMVVGGDKQDSEAA